MGYLDALFLSPHTYQSVDGCGGLYALVTACFCMATSAALASVTNCCGVCHLAPLCMIVDLIICTVSTLLVLRQLLQHLCAPLTLSPLYGEPPIATGTSSSSTGCSGSRLGLVRSSGNSHNQHGSPLANMRARRALRRLLFVRRGFPRLRICPPHKAKGLPHRTAPI